MTTRSSALTGSIVCAALLVSACDLLYPPPSPAPPQVVSLADPEVRSWILGTATELSCHQRMRELAWQGPCYDVYTPLGEEARCQVDAPGVETLVFGCGNAPKPIVPDPEQVFAERLRLELDPDAPDATRHLLERLEARIGRCRPVARGPAGDHAPRYRGDIGLRVCLAPPIQTDAGTLTSAMMRYPGLTTDHPMGLYLELAPDDEDDDRDDRGRHHDTERELRVQALVVDTELLDPASRQAARALVPMLLDLVADDALDFE